MKQIFTLTLFSFGDAAPIGGGEQPEQTAPQMDKIAARKAEAAQETHFPKKTEVGEKSSPEEDSITLPENAESVAKKQTEANPQPKPEVSVAVRSVLEELARRYGTDDPAALRAALLRENETLTEAAGAEEMTAADYLRAAKSRKEAQADRAERVSEISRARAVELAGQWSKQATEAGVKYPGLNLAEEAKNPVFRQMLRAGLPVGQAYAAAHHDELLASAASDAEKRVIDHVRARGMRPEENGARAETGILIRQDVSRLSRGDRAEAVRRAMNGDRVTF